MFEDALKVAPAYISKPVGAYRLDERYIKGVDIKLSASSKISNDLENLLYRFDSNNMTLEDIAEFHILFERVHPFADGNGRVGRLIMAFQAIQNNIVPPLIENEHRSKYLKAMHDKNELFKFIDKSIQNSMDLLYETSKNHDDTSS